MEKQTSKKRWIAYGLVCLATIVQGMIGSGFVNTSYSTLERKFHFHSTTTGVISGFYNLGSLLSILPLSHLAGQKGAPKLRYIAVGLMTMGLGSVLFSLPHFISSPSERKSVASESNLCNVDLTSSEEVSSDPIYYTPFFMIGHFFHGAGACCIFPVGATYLHEWFPDAPMFVAAWTTLFFVGPAFGFVTNGFLLKVNAYFYRLSSLSSISNNDGQFIGAWWIGFMISVTVCSILGTILFFGHSCLKPKEAETETETRVPITEHLKKLPTAIKKLLTNPTYVFIVLFLAMDDCLITSLATFLPKYTEAQFGITPSTAAFLVGGLTVATACVGALLGSWIAEHFQFDRNGLIKFYIISQGIAFALGFGFLLYCPQVHFSGVTEAQPIVKSVYQMEDLQVYCNSDCKCKEEYEPVCGGNNVQFYNPCFAGCHSKNESGDNFSDCDCIDGTDSQAYAGICKTDCNNLTYFLVILSIIMILFFLPTKPSLDMITETVEPELTSLGFAVEMVTLKIFGTIPGPIIMGAIVDKACLLFSGSCIIYENFKLATFVLAFLSVGKALGLIFAICSYRASLKLGPRQISVT